MTTAALTTTAQVTSQGFIFTHFLLAYFATFNCFRTLIIEFAICLLSVWTTQLPTTLHFPHLHNFYRMVKMCDIWPNLAFETLQFQTKRPLKAHVQSAQRQPQEYLLSQHLSVLIQWFSAVATLRTLAQTSTIDEFYTIQQSSLSYVRFQFSKCIHRRV